VDHRCFVATLIRSQLDQLEEHLQDREFAEETKTQSSKIIQTPHFELRSQQKPKTYEALQKDHANNPAFNRFRIRLAEFMNNYLQVHQLGQPDRAYPNFRPDDTVSECPAWLLWLAILTHVLH
jgi:hypothetical protein